ncbi:hypothetical protein [Streptomyces sp. NBC_01565]|nr:hypothetical protein [Streptomyces sp. NBC_01565]MCX4547007.1 hypothetical protein [Streptomyces sp. NBC_01565]
MAASAYDDVAGTDATHLDVDHFGPLAEDFDSERTAVDGSPADPVMRFRL